MFTPAYFQESIRLTSAVVIVCVDERAEEAFAWLPQKQNEQYLVIMCQSRV